MKRTIMLLIVGMTFTIGILFSVYGLAHNFINQQLAISDLTQQNKEQQSQYPELNTRIIQNESPDVKMSHEDVREVQDKIALIQKNLTDADKLKITEIVMEKITRDDLAEILDMLDNGLSPEELEKARELAESKLTEEELLQLKEMYQKYEGLNLQQ